MTRSVSSEQIPRIDLLLHVVKAAVITVRDDRVRARLELFKIIHHKASEESYTVRKGRLIDDNSCALSLDSLHNTLNRGLTEVVTV